jgi:predicted restriction endonuclease
MAKLIQLTDNSWRQPFKDRKKDMHLWGSHTTVAKKCQLENGTKRKLNIKFEDKFNINETGLFQITSGKEISFPKAVVNKIGSIVIDNPDSYFIVTVLDVHDHAVNNEQEQNEIVDELKKQNKSRQDVIDELKRLKKTDSKTVIIKSNVFRRDNKTIAQLKFIRDFKCQICSTSIEKKDGSFYIEAAHIKAKHQQGAETPDNIILLCPNHHKEFDLGKKVIVKHDKKLIIFKLNGVQYKLTLELK